MSSKLVLAVWGHSGADPARLCEHLVEVAGPRLVQVASGVQVNVSDGVVSDAQLRITRFDEPVGGVVSLWLDEQDAGPALTALAAEGGPVAGVEGWWVEETVPLPPPLGEPGHRLPGLANVAFLRRPAEMDQAHWRDRWKSHHTPVAIAMQATFGYVQNEVLAPATPGAAEIAAVVEELFPIEALTSMHAFYGSGGDNAELGRRMAAMLTSVASFGADRDIDVVPTSRYVFA